MAHKKYEANKQKFAAKLFEAYPALGENADEVFAKIATYDPTTAHKDERHKYVYQEWVCSRVLKENPREQDLYKIREDLNTYILLARLDKFKASDPRTIFYRPSVNADIGQYSIASLGAAILPYESQIKDRKKSSADLENERAKAESETVILFDGPTGRIVVPQTMEASQYWGKATKWCISATKSDNLFDTYYNEGKTPIIMFLPKGTAQKYAFNEHDKSAARDATDVAIINIRKPQATDSPHIKPLGDFIMSALTAEGFKNGMIEEDENLKRTFQSFTIWNPQVYHYILEEMGEDALPDYLKISEIVQSADSAAETNLNIGVDIIERLGKLIMAPPKVPFEKPADYVADFGVKHSRLSKLQEHTSALWNDEGDVLILDYLNAVPQEFWKDEEFALKFVQEIGYILRPSVDALPEMYDHPKVLSYLLHIAEMDGFPSIVGEHPFTKGWTGTINGVPLLETIQDEPHACRFAVLSDMRDASNLYKSAARAEGVDLSPIVRHMETIYTDGFETPDQIGYASNDMPECDFTTLLEKTIQNNPDWFEDVAPEKQTMPMAIAAVRHDPGSLADMAAHLFKGNTRPPELTAAFNKLPPDSMEREAVADYFMVPWVK